MRRQYERFVSAEKANNDKKSVGGLQLINLWIISRLGSPSISRSHIGNISDLGQDQVAVISCKPEPCGHVFCLMKYGPHLLYLPTLFDVVRLVDTNGINPEIRAHCNMSQS
jgi:hypothetical protein